MNGVLLMVVAAAVLACGYLGYGRWLANKWGVDKEALTPAKRMKDGNSFSPVSAFTAFSHQFSSICGAGPVTGTIVAMAFGWLPVVLWVLVGGIFFGAVHDFGALYASMKNNGKSRSAHREVYRQDRPSPVPAVLLAVLHYRHRRLYRHGLQDVHVHPGR